MDERGCLGGEEFIGFFLEATRRGCHRWTVGRFVGMVVVVVVVVGEVEVVEVVMLMEWNKISRNVATRNTVLNT